MIKWLVIIVLLAAIIGGGVWYYQEHNGPDTEYQTAAVSKGDVTQAVTATGQLNPVVSVQVGSQVSGRIEKIFVDYNSEVKSNQVIAQIDPSSYKSAMLKAEADLANANANLVLAQVQATRAEALFTNKLISASDHDTAIAQAQQAAAAVQSSQANVENAKVDLSRCTIYAPVDGVVITRNVDVGQTVASSFNTPTLFLIANDLAQMQIDALVSEADIGGVTVGQSTQFTVDAYPYRTFRGRVKQIRYGAVTNQNVVNYDCVIAVKNDDLKLLPGMTANLSIIIAARTNVMRVPNSALRFRPPEVIAAETNSIVKAMAQQTAQPQGGGPGGGGGRQSAANGENAGGQARRGGEGGSRGGAGEKGGGGGKPGGAAKKKETGGPRTVYVVENPGAKNPKLKPIKVMTGITDGAFTEVTEGLQEGQEVVTALLASTSSSASQRPSNPFGGGFRPR